MTSENRPRLVAVGFRSVLLVAVALQAGCGSSSREVIEGTETPESAAGLLESSRETGARMSDLSPADREFANPDERTQSNSPVEIRRQDDSPRPDELQHAQNVPPMKIEPARKVDPSDEFFEKGMIPEIRITLSQKEEERLRRDERRYVNVSFTENETTSYTKVRMKLKGAAGSFRELDDRPALTLSMKKKNERFHGLEKFHLNNSVQDETYLNELISSQLCHEAKVPAARTTHARVWLNGRDLGFYVLKEGLDDRFLKRHFKDPKGNLYEGGFCADIDTPLEKECGEGPEDGSDLNSPLKKMPHTEA